MSSGKIMPSFDSKRQRLGDIYPLDTPFNVIVDISEVCNFKCKYCFRAEENKAVWGYAKDNGLMAWDTFTKAVESIKAFPEGVKQISLSCHGEPLCNRKLPDMVKFIKDQGIKSKVSIHTNASLLNRKYIDELIDSGIDKIVISLQGLSSKEYERVCGYAIEYSNFYENLQYLFSVKKNTQIYIKIMDLALGDGEEEIFYNRFLPIADRAFVERAVPIWEGVDFTQDDIIYNKYGQKFPQQMCCPLIFHTIVISPTGDVYPCTQLLMPEVLGNIHNKSLVDLWNGEKRNNLLIRQCKNENSEICKDCYILQNSIFSEEDMIDSHKNEILNRLLKGKKVYD